MIVNRLAGANEAIEGDSGAKARPFRLIEDGFILSEQARTITEPKYHDGLLYAWMGSAPRESAADRIAADQRSVNRQMEVAFA